MIKLETLITRLLSIMFLSIYLPILLIYNPGFIGIKFQLPYTRVPYAYFGHILTLQNTFSPGYPALQSPEFLSRASSLRSHLREGEGAVYQIREIRIIGAKPPKNLRRVI